MVACIADQITGIEGILVQGLYFYGKQDSKLFFTCACRVCAYCMCILYLDMNSMAIGL